MEDDQFLAELLEKKLTAHNFDTERAVDAEESARVLKAKKIDCILLDIVLPGVDGFAILQQIKSDANLKDIPVLVLSNLGGAEEKEKSLKFGAKSFLVKAEHSPESIADNVEKVFI